MVTNFGLYFVKYSPYRKILKVKTAGLHEASCTGSKHLFVYNEMRHAVVRKIKGIDHLRDIDVGERVILKRILRT
jgi:hypothetical protein